MGKEAVSSILAKYPNAHVQVEQLDISNSKSIDEFVQVVKQKYKTIDVLVNNAGVAAKGDAFDSEVIKFTFDTVKSSLLRTSTEQLNSHKNYCHLFQIMVKL